MRLRLKLRAALAVFRRKMEAGADKTESQLAAGKCELLKKFDQNFNLFYSSLTRWA
jgi:hypothetical protein